MGRSCEVLCEIAEKCNLVYEPPKILPVDVQTWLNVCKTRSAFVRDVVRHGWVDSNSIMSSALTSLGVLKYKDLNYLIQQEPDYALFTNVNPTKFKGKTYRVHMAEHGSKSGLTNNWVNYGSTRVEHSLSGVKVVHDHIDVATKANYLPINIEVSKTVGRSRIDYSPIDCGNTHANYEKAIYQNVKMLALFSEHQSVMLLECTDIQLYDVIAYKQADSDPTDFTLTSDRYIVVGKTVFIKGGKIYAERLELVRMSCKDGGKTQLKSQEPLERRRSVMPESIINTVGNKTGGFAQVAMRIKDATSGISNAVSFVRGSVNRAIGLVNTINRTIVPLVGAIAHGDINAISQNLNSTLSAFGVTDSGVLAIAGAVSDSANVYNNTIGVYSDVTSFLNNPANDIIANLGLAVGDKVGASALIVGSGLHTTGVQDVATCLALGLPTANSVANTISTIKSIQTMAQTTDGISATQLLALQHQIDALTSSYNQLNSRLSTLWNMVVAQSNMSWTPSNTLNIPSTNIDTFHGIMTVRDTVKNATAKSGSVYTKVCSIRRTVNDISASLYTDINNQTPWLIPSESMFETTVWYDASAQGTNNIQYFLASIESSSQLATNTQYLVDES